MIFHVGPHKYQVVVSDRPIYDTEGNELEALAVEQRRLLIISYRVEPDRREEVALHELAHAYEFHVPPPRTAEERCQLFAMKAQQFREDIDAQGGPERLKELLPMPIPHRSQPAPTRSAIAPASIEPYGVLDRIECGGCGADIMCGEIHNGHPFQHEYTGHWMMQRHGRCDACGVLQVWREYCSPDGIGTGVFVPNPRPMMLRGLEAREWLGQHSAQKV